MAHSCIRTVSGDGFKAWLNVALLLFSKAFQFRCNRKLVHWDFADVLFQPVNIFCNSNAVFNVGFSDIFHFCWIFDSFHKCGRIYHINNSVVSCKTLEDRIIHMTFFQKNGFAFDFRHKIIYRIIGMNFHSKRLKIRFYFFR